ISNGKKKGGDSDGSSDEDDTSDEDDEDGVEHDDYGVPNTSTKKAPKINVSASDLAFKPNPSALAKPLDDPSAAGSDLKGSHKDGVYRPPRITAMLMPELDKPAAKKDRVRKSDTLDEYVASEHSGAPLAMPSIGTTIAAHGRSVQTQRQREEDLRRREYE